MHDETPGELIFRWCCEDCGMVHLNFIFADEVKSEWNNRLKVFWYSVNRKCECSIVPFTVAVE